MHLTDVLSDLNSLRACDPDAALKLVSQRPSPTTATSSPQTHSAGSMTLASSNGDSDSDLARPGILLHLHRTVKLAYTSPSAARSGSSLNDLHNAREDVRRILTSLGSGVNAHHSSGNPSAAHDQTNADDEEVAAWS